MAVIYQNDFSVLTDFTLIQTDGTVTVATDGSDFYARHGNKTANSWDVLGLYSTSAITTGANGHVIYFKFRRGPSAIGTTDFMLLLRNATGITFTSQPGVYLEASSAELGTWNGGGTTPHVVVGNDETWLWAKFTINTDHYDVAMIDTEVKGNKDNPYEYSPAAWTALASTTAAATYNPVGAGIRFATNFHNIDGGTGRRVDVTQLYYTDNGIIPIDTTTGDDGMPLPVKWKKSGRDRLMLGKPRR